VSAVESGPAAPAPGISAQSASRTVIAQSGARAISLLAVVGSTAIVARQVGIGTYADWATVLSLVALVSFALDPGVSPIIVRRIAQAPDRVPDPRALVPLRLALSLVSLGIVVAVAAALRGGHAALLALVLGGQVVPRAMVLNATPWLQADHRLHRQTVLEAVCAFLGLALLAAAAAAGASAPVLALVGFTAPTALLSLLVLREQERTPSRAAIVPGDQRARVVSVLREVAPLAGALVLVTLYTRIFTVFLNAGEDSTTVARYLFAFQFIEQLLVAAGIVAGAVLPLLAVRGREQTLLTDRPTHELLIAVAAVGALGSAALLAFAGPLTHVIGGAKLAPAGDFLVLLSPTSAVILPAFVLAYLYVAVERSRRYLVMNLVALVANLAANATLTLTYGAQATARIAWGTELLVVVMALWPVVRSGRSGAVLGGIFALTISASVAAAEATASGAVAPGVAALLLVIVVLAVARRPLGRMVRTVVPRSEDADAPDVVSFLRHPVRHVPRPLAALLLAALALGAAWTFVTPAWQAPDENSHFGFVQYFAETGHLPGDPKLPIFSTEQQNAAAGSNADQAAANIGTRMAWSRSDYESWRANQRRLPASSHRDGGGPNPASSNPPLYYVYAAPAYLLGKGTDIFGRLELVRLASVLWLLVTVAGAWLLAGEIFGRDRAAQLCTAGAVALAPMVQFISSTASPDTMLFAAWSLMLWLGVRLLRRGITPGGAAALMAVAGGACLVKATSYAALPAVVLCLAIALVRAGALRRPLQHWRPVVAAAAGLLLTLGAYVVWTRATGRAVSTQVASVSGQAGNSSARELLSYVWQFYLPRLPFQTDFPTTAQTIPVWDFALKGVWGTFGWLEILFSGPVYLVMAAITLACGALSVLGLWRDRRSVDWGVAAFLALVVVGLLAGLHYTEYRQLKSGSSNFFQGRYLLPLAPLAGLALTRALRWLPTPRQAPAIAISLGALFVLDVFSLALVTVRFYA
jgi:O-antigen/teichoic acid export membrane protein